MLCKFVNINILFILKELLKLTLAHMKELFMSPIISKQ